MFNRIMIFVFLLTIISYAQQSEIGDPEKFWRDFMELNPTDDELVKIVKAHPPFNSYAIFELSRRKEKLSQENKIKIIEKLVSLKMPQEYVAFWWKEFKQSAGVEDMLNFIISTPVQPDVNGNGATYPFLETYFKEAERIVAAGSCNFSGERAVLFNHYFGKYSHAIVSCFLNSNPSKFELIDFISSLNIYGYPLSVIKQANKLIREVLYRSDIRNDERKAVWIKARYFISLSNKEKIIKDILYYNPTPEDLRFIFLKTEYDAEFRIYNHLVQEMLGVLPDQRDPNLETRKNMAQKIGVNFLK